MRAFWRGGVWLAAALAFWSLGASAWDRGAVEKFATLPSGQANPEGLTVDKHGDVYVTTFGVSAPAGTPGQLFVFDARGNLKRQVSVAGSSSFLLGLAFHPQTNDLLVID